MAEKQNPYYTNKSDACFTKLQAPVPVKPETMKQQKNNQSKIAIEKNSRENPEKVHWDDLVSAEEMEFDDIDLFDGLAEQKVESKPSQFTTARQLTGVSESTIEEQPRLQSKTTVPKAGWPRSFEDKTREVDHRKKRASSALLGRSEKTGSSGKNFQVHNRRTGRKETEEWPIWAGLVTSGRSPMEEKRQEDLLFNSNVT